MKMIFALGIAALFMVSAYSNDNAPKQPTQWQKIYSWNFAGTKGFVDENSRVRDFSNSNVEYSSATILIVYDEPTEFVFDGKKVRGKSIAKVIDMDCKTGYSAILFDFVFNESLPESTHTPIVWREYRPVAKDFIRVPKTALLYKTLCPNLV
jgi:hypothetical protein